LASLLDLVRITGDIVTGQYIRAVRSTITDRDGGGIARDKSGAVTGGTTSLLPTHATLPLELVDDLGNVYYWQAELV